MTNGTKEELRRLINSMPLDAKQRNMLNKGIDNMPPDKAEEVLSNLAKALTVDLEKVRESIRLYKEKSQNKK